ncbi:D-2-hydroxyacid dehydrogenase [Halarchaeum nitratireducens]|uniref:Phosphoglycerate dehydrogenase n=1 Tax=Halarchaeum nitratireducens TaxID=489913 RepID=A0A830G9G1_9EURY|nr:MULTISPECIES: D-2-hydroxyacid dehydrogenase [Halarchaeum]MBP2249868.1 D-2-hydroxyacid dehydrogenase (NADP+) [Halarchaeum solikamskense]GGN10065.1 phosphoglycerate dehydrogenase [Halarchaeum nitratireducens]
MSNPLDLDRIAIHDWGTHPCYPSDLRDRLAAADDDRAYVVRDAADLDDCDAVVTLYHHDAFPDAVEWVHCVRSGYDDFPLDAYEDAGVLVTNSTGVAGDLVGESAIALVLSLAKGLHLYRDQQAEREWSRLPVERPFELGRSSACVVGLGQLGGGVASRVNALGMSVTGVDVRPVSQLGLEAVHDVVQLERAVAESRFVVLTTPLTPDTRGLVDADVFAAMRDDAYLVNVSRGAVVDQDALLAALDAGEIAGAALDVFDEEPLPASSPLWDRDDVVVTPHAAAQSDNHGEKLARLVETNAARLTAGRDPWNRVV